MKKKLVCMLVLLIALLAASGALALSKGDTVTFGTYPQTAGGGLAPLRWLVLDVQGDEALLITEKVIDAMDYGSKNPLYWENSDLRKWLNGTFLSTAFTAEERGALVQTRVIDSDDRGKQTVTNDYVFILDAEEAKRYFAADSERRSVPTQYAREKGLRVSGGAWYWLRSKSDMYRLFGDVFSYVDTDGSVYIRGATAKRANKESMGVRPVCRVKASALDGAASGAADPVREAVTFSTKAPGQAKTTPSPAPTKTPAPTGTPAPTEAPAAEPAEAEEGKGTLAEGANPVFVLSYGAGVLIGKGYLPDLAALTNLEALAAQVEAGRVSVKADPFVITVYCPNDPERAESVQVGLTRVTDKSMGDMLTVFASYLSKFAGIGADQAADTITRLAEGLAAGQKLQSIQLDGYDVTMEADETSDEAFRLILSLHQDAPAEPALSTEGPILFRGIAYGITYADFADRMQKIGLKSYGNSPETVETWELNTDFQALRGEASLRNGGYSFSVYANSASQPITVAGLPLNSMRAFFLKAHDGKKVFDDQSRSVFYKAVYTFVVADVDAAYALLSQKLTSLYGEGVETKHPEKYDEKKGKVYVNVWTTWLGGNHTGIRLMKNCYVLDGEHYPQSGQLELCYGVTNSWEMMEALRLVMAEQEMKEALDMSNVDGL